VDQFSIKIWYRFRLTNTRSLLYFLLGHFSTSSYLGNICFHKLHHCYSGYYAINLSTKVTKAVFCENKKLRSRDFSLDRSLIIISNETVFLLFCIVFISYYFYTYLLRKNFYLFSQIRLHFIPGWIFYNGWELTSYKHTT
jgi:hypothetical protein